MTKPLIVTSEMLNLEPFRGQLRAMGKAARGSILKTALARAGEVVRLYATNNIREWNLIDTGALVNSISVMVKRAEVWIFSNLVYAAIHELGGEIYPVNAQHLSVPLSDTARDVGSPRNYPGELHVQGETLADDDGVPQYALVDSVTIPARPYLEPAVTEHIDEITEVFAGAIREGLQAATSGGSE
jgi:phage gpG-like protein